MLTALRDALGGVGPWVIVGGVVLAWLAIRAVRLVSRLAFGAAALGLMATGAVPWIGPDLGGLGPLAPAPPPATAPPTAADPLPPAEGAWTATVERVVDGDTLRLEVGGGSGEGPEPGTQVRARLLRIDTPELARDDRPAECQAREARDRLASLVPPGSTVTAAWDVERHDLYGRELVHLWASDGRWVNGAMLRSGHATVMTVPPNVAHDDRVRAIERSARDRGAGRWAAC